MKSNRYSTGKPCKNGHASERFVATRKCVECSRENSRRWSAAHPEEAKRIRTTPENRKKSYRKYQAANRDKSSAYYFENRDRILARVTAYSKANPEKVRPHKRNHKALKRGAEGHHTSEEIQELLKKQQHRCANPRCRVSLRDAYQADHITPLTRGGSNWIKNIQLLCPSCNQRKHAKDPLDWARENGLLV